METVTKEKNLMADLHELGGKVLGCWFDGDCHGNVLIDLINKHLSSQTKSSTSHLISEACTMSGLSESYVDLFNHRQ